MTYPAGLKSTMTNNYCHMNDQKTKSRKDSFYILWAVRDSIFLLEKSPGMPPDFPSCPSPKYITKLP